jgi:predicted phosphodiesterase
MKILHLTDVHFDSKKNPLLEGLRDKLLDLLTKNKIDYFIFSGDLASNPQKIEDFNKAKQFLIDPILERCSLKENAFFICEGNHDVQRDQELPLFKDTFSKFKKLQELEEFVSVQKGKQLEATLQNHQLYFDFVKSIYTPFGDVIDPLFTIHKRQHGDQLINFVTINSSWRSNSSITDPGNLFYPISTLRDVISKTDKNALKIFIMHHPLREFKEFVSREMEDLIYDNFHVMFTGHLHKKNHSLHFANDIGIFCSSSQAIFSKNVDGIELGFSIIDFDAKYLEFSLVNYFYHENDNCFYEKEPINSRIPLSSEKEEQNKLRKTFKKRFEEGALKADELLLLSSEDDSTFLELFVDPIIYDKPKSQIKSNPELYKLINLMASDDNYLIFGKDKYGKTSVLFKLYLELLDTFTENRIIPYFIDLKLYKYSSEKFDLIKNLVVFCETNITKIGNFCNTYKIKLIIDNYNSDNVHINEEILKLISNCKNISIIATVEETLISAYQNHTLNNHKFKNLFIHEIGRTQVRNLTNKWPAIKEEQKEETIEKVSRIFNQLNIPYNYWTVSLFLWVYNKTKESNFHNNFELIQLYIDGLLERSKHVTNKGIKISYEDLKEYLGFLAFKLVKEHYEDSHSVDYLKLVGITSEYRDKNSRIVIETSELIDLVIQRGIIKKSEDEKFTFRLNGVFEYFIAYYMKDDKEFAFGLIKDESFYLSFYNEFELYAGFNRKDKDFLEAIFKKTQEVFSGIINRYAENGDIDSNLTNRIVDIDQLTKGLTAASEKSNFVLDHKEQDNIFDDLAPVNQGTSGVKQKKYIEKIEEISDHLEKALFILCRVFRNCNINDPELDKKILNYILDSTCNLGFLLIDETKEEALSDKKISAHEKTLIRLVMDLMPMVIQTFLFEALAQNNLERLLEEKLEELKKNPKGNQFKLFIVYYLLIDLDFKNKRHLINEMMDVIKLGVLKHSNLVKLYLYLAFKAHGKKELEAEIQGYIRTQEKLISPKKSDDHTTLVNQKIEMTKKIGRVSRKRRS